MDAWTDVQLAFMKVGGNKQCNDFLQKHGVAVGTASIREKYESPAAELYKQVLQARVEGKPEPTILPISKQKQPVNTDSSQPKKMQGFGSSPPPEKNAGKVQRTLRVAVPLAAGVAAAAVFFSRFSPPKTQEGSSTYTTVLD
jgi:ADP-ribosylation factor GTPase-activating protein 1